MNSKNPKLHASVLNCAYIEAKGGYQNLYIDEEYQRHSLKREDLTPLQWQQLDRVCQLQYEGQNIEGYEREMPKEDLYKLADCPYFRTVTAPDGTVFEEVEIGMGGNPMSYWFYPGTLELAPVAFSDWGCIDRGWNSEFPWPPLSVSPDTVSQRCRLVEGEGMWSEMVFYYEVLDKALVSDIFKVDLVWNTAIPKLENESPVRQFQFRRSIYSGDVKHRFHLNLGFGLHGSNKYWYSALVEIDGENMKVEVIRPEPGQNLGMGTKFKSRYQCELLPFDRIELHEQSFS